MSSEMTLQLLWGVLGIIALFSVVIVLGLRVRKAQMARNLQLRAEQLWAPFANGGFQRNELLYGVRQDRSMLEIEMLVRDSTDEEVGRVVWHGGKRMGALTISIAAASFTADILPTMSRRAVLHPANDASEILCTFDRSWSGAHRFQVAGVGLLQSRRRMRFVQAPISNLTLDGVRVGVSQHIGGAIDRGVLLILPPSIPLHVRMFVLAFQ